MQDPREPLLFKVGAEVMKTNMKVDDTLEGCVAVVVGEICVSYAGVKNLSLQHLDSCSLPKFSLLSMMTRLI